MYLYDVMMFSVGAVSLLRFIESGSHLEGAPTTFDESRVWKLHLRIHESMAWRKHGFYMAFLCML